MDNLWLVKKTALLKTPFCLCYLWLAAGTKQHGHVSEHANDGERNGRNALGVQHVWIVSTSGVTEDVACLSAVTSVSRQ